jgi:RNA polymerase sigma-70 factor (ECF subfamily)
MSAHERPLAGQYRDVLHFVRRRVRTAEDAEDVAQEVFASAAAALARSAQAASPSTAWLYTVARRRIVDEARRRDRTRTVSLEVVEPHAAAEAPYGGSVAQRLASALATLPPGQRIVLLGRLIQGRSFAELAREAGVSEDACRMRFMRGLQHVREEFEKEGLRP